MTGLLTAEQKDRLFERLITNASHILCEELGLPEKTFQELQEQFEKWEENLTEIPTDL